MTTPSFRHGADEAKAASKSSFAKTEYLKIEDGEQVTVRFLTDVADWVTVEQHAMVPTKPKPDKFEGNWPPKMGAVCRNDPAFAGMYDGCYICDHIVDGKAVRPAASRTWALACIREEVKENGQIVGYKDKTRKVTRKDGDKEVEVEEKDIVVVNMAYRNFFGPLTSLAEFYGGTCVDRDFVIKRQGNDQSTNYTLIGLDPIHVNIEGEAVKLDLRDPRFKDRYQPGETLEEVVASRASDDFYARFFDPRFTPSEKEGEAVKSTGQAAEQPKPSTDVDDEAKLAALAQRVQTYGQAGGGDGNGGAAPPAEQPAAAAPAGAPRDFG